MLLGGDYLRFLALASRVPGLPPGMTQLMLDSAESRRMRAAASAVVGGFAARCCLHPELDRVVPPRPGRAIQKATYGSRAIHYRLSSNLDRMSRAATAGIWQRLELSTSDYVD
jgi:hypothetical protein